MGHTRQYVEALIGKAYDCFQTTNARVLGYIKGNSGCSIRQIEEGTKYTLKEVEASISELSKFGVIRQNDFHGYEVSRLGVENLRMFLEVLDKK